MPLFRIVPPSGERKEASLESLSAPVRRKTDAEIQAEQLQAHQRDREAESYGRLSAAPLSSEGRYGPPGTQEDAVITEETRKRLEQEEQDKASVPNVVTTHADVAKVAKGAEVGVVPTVDVYTQDDPLEGKRVLSVTDPTVVNPGVRPLEQVIDRADVTLAQPEGDEYSAKSATGPHLPEGRAAQPEGEVEKVYSPDQPVGDIQAQAAQSADEAAEESARVTEKSAKAARSSGKAASKGGKK